jgi:hypothetical protein
MSKWIKVCFSKEVVFRALITALVVGSILAVINYGESLLHRTITSEQIARMLLTFLVPYCVSTYSSVSTVRSMERSSSR